MTTHEAIVKRLRSCAEDPMWADHAEIPKGWCTWAADAITQLQRDNAALMQDAAAQIQIAREAVERAAGLVLEETAKEFDRRASQWDYQCRGYRWNRQLAVMLREAIRELAKGEPS